MVEGILFVAWINVLRHGLSQLGISRAGFIPPEVKKKGITLQVILAMSCWVLLSLIQPYKGLNPVLLRLPFWLLLEKQCGCPRWYGEKAWTKHVLRDSKWALFGRQEKKGTRKHRVEPQWALPRTSTEFFLQLLERSICSLLTFLHPNLFFFCDIFKRMKSPNKAELRTFETPLTYLRACVNLKVILSQSFPAIQSYLL